MALVAVSDADGDSNGKLVVLVDVGEVGEVTDVFVEGSGVVLIVDIDSVESKDVVVAIAAAVSESSDEDSRTVSSTRGAAGVVVVVIVALSLYRLTD